MKDTGKPRAKGASAPGRKPPPESAKFTSTNQPSGEAKKNGRLKNKTGIELARAILQLSFEGAKDSPLKKAAAEYFKISEQEITVEMMLLFRQAEKAIQKGDTRAFEAVMDRAFGKAKQEIQADITTNGESIHTTVVIQDPRGQGAAE